MNITEVFKKIEEVKLVDIKNYDFIAFFDGACLPVNPYGNMGIGMAVFDNQGKEITSYSSEKPPNLKNSNNVAEYYGINKALNYFYENGLTDKRILILGDSNLVVNQLNEIWDIKDGLYTEQAIIAQSLVSEFKNLRILWIPRELNGYADILSRQKLVMNGDKGFKLAEYKKLKDKPEKEKVDFLLNHYLTILNK